MGRRASDGDSSPKIPRPPKLPVNPYVNLSSSPSLSLNRRTTGFTEHIYANLPSHSQRLATVAAPTIDNHYENWKPPKGHSPSHKSLKDHTPPTHDLPPTDSPVPPPLILRRQETDGDKETQQDVPDPISPTVPSMSYSQVNIGSPFEQPDKSEGMQSPDNRSSGEQVNPPDLKPTNSNEPNCESRTQSPDASSPERKLSSPVEDSPRRKKKPIPLPRHSISESGKKSPQLTDSLLDSFADSDEVDRLSGSKSPPSSLNSVTEKSTRPVESMPHQPLTKRPSLMACSQVEPKAALSKSLSQPPTIKTKPGIIRTLPKTSVRPEHGSSNSPTELMRKLTQRRLQLEKQIEDPKNSNSNNNWMEQHESPAASTRESSCSNQSECIVSYHTSWREEDESDNTLAKYGIVEDKSGGSFIV